jgi:hypothetical protein
MYSNFNSKNALLGPRTPHISLKTDTCIQKHMYILNEYVQTLQNEGNG